MVGKDNINLLSLRTSQTILPMVCVCIFS